MILCTLPALLGLETAAAAAIDDSGRPGTVYVVLAVDTETRALAPYDSVPALDLRDFEDSGAVGRMMAGSVRCRFLDSDSRPPRFTWFVLTHRGYLSAGQSGAVVLNTLARHNAAMDRFGDLIGWHYHNRDWQPALDGGSWRQITTFSGTRAVHGTDVGMAEQMIAQLIIERGLYPAVFRSGWDWEDTDLSNWLDSVVPFDFSNAAPLRYGAAVLESESLDHDRYDWSRAPDDWTPYHPSQCDYQLPGELRRIVFRCLPGHRSSDLPLEAAFARAARGEDVVVAAYTHSYSDLEKSCRVVVGSISNACTVYPTVRFRFANALEAARAALGLSDSIAPTCRVERDQQWLTIIVDEPLFAFPFGAVRTLDYRFVRLRPRSDRPDTTQGDYRWTFDLNGLRFDLFAAGGTDPAGNSLVTDLYSRQPLSPPQAHEKTDRP